VRPSDVQKDYHLQLPVMQAPLFILMKQLEVDADTLFYQVLEERGEIRKKVLDYLA